MGQKHFASFQDELDYYRDGGSSGHKHYARCYERHPPLPLNNGLVVYGGSCSYPVVADADIYIGFDYSMRRDEHYPWNKEHSGPVEIYFHIPDGAAPKNAAEFKKMIEWTALQLIAGKKVHAGCIGGHGRTGTFLAALVAHMMGEEDAITYVRKNYCQKAVESKSQVEFLHKHYGIKKVDGSTGFLSRALLSKSGGGWNQSTTSNTSSMPKPGGYGSSGSSKSKSPKAPIDFKSAAKQIHPVESARNIWVASV